MYVLLQEILDRVDTVNDVTNKEFTTNFLPKLDEFLKELPPQLEDNSIHCVRNVVLKIFQKVSGHSLPPDQLQKIHDS